MKILCLFGILFSNNILAKGNLLPIDTTIHIDAISPMQFDVVRFKVPPNTRIGIILYNNDDMPHNFVITKPDSRIKVLKLIEELGKQGNLTSYSPDINEILWSIPILHPNESKRLFFTTPAEEGIYPYVCTLPGHGYIMFGAMYVTNGSLPDLSIDTNIPETRRNLLDSPINRSYPYNYLYRMFMPEASPASIAVNLSDSISYCWDSSTCNLLYCWRGDFIDNTESWKGHVNAFAKVKGDIIYNNDEENRLFPDFAFNVRNIVYHGYEIIDNQPKFMYSINNVNIYEYIYVSNQNEENLVLYKELTLENWYRKYVYVLGKNESLVNSSTNVLDKNNTIELLPSLSGSKIIIKIAEYVNK